MSGKLEENGFWESSRMMIPQHKEQLLKQAREWDKQKRPTLDPQEQEIFQQEIGRAMHEMLEVTIRIFGEYGDRTIVGVPVNFKQHSGLLKLQRGDEYDWVQFDDIVGVSLED